MKLINVKLKVMTVYDIEEMFNVQKVKKDTF